MTKTDIPTDAQRPGLRVELSWEHPEPPGDLTGVDLDLHQLDVAVVEQCAGDFDEQQHCDDAAAGNQSARLYAAYTSPDAADAARRCRGRLYHREG